MGVGRFSNWNVHYRPGAIDGLPQIVSDSRWGRVLIVCGAHSFSASGAARVLPALKAAASVSMFDDFRPNTDAADLLVGLRLIEDEPVDAILGIGGGSALDMAKLLTVYSGITDADALRGAIESHRIHDRVHGLVLAPTTSGSGSEATHFAVVYVGDTKYSIADSQLRPDHIVLDPMLAVSGSSDQRATSGIDAICQATESLWAVGATPTSRQNARWALAHLMPSIRSFVAGADEASARSMAIGSHLAGRAIDESKTTAAHALSYRITKRFGVSHGHAVALTLGAFIDAHQEADVVALQPGVQLDDHRTAMDQIRHRFGITGNTTGLQAVSQLLSDLGLPSRLREVGVNESDLPELVDSVNPERLGNNPVLLSRDDLMDLVSKSL